MKKLLFLIAIGMLSGSLIAKHEYKMHDKKHKSEKKAKAKKRKPMAAKETFAVEEFKDMPRSQAGFKEVVGGIFG